jgi:hypothetical protein
MGHLPRDAERRQSAVGEEIPYFLR